MSHRHLFRSMAMAPSILSLNFDIPNGTSYIDCAQSLSAVNRRLYRQGKMYYLQSVEIETSGVAEAKLTDFTLDVIPDTWVTRNAWYKAFRLWKEMNKMVLDENPSIKPKWQDFKVYFDGVHALTDMNTANLQVQGVTSAVPRGEWNDSTMTPAEQVQVTGSDPVTDVSIVTDQFKLHVLGEDIGGPLPDAYLTSAAIIQGYADTRARETSLSTPAEMKDSWMTLLNQRDIFSTETLAENIEAENDFPPYDKDKYPGMTGSGFETGQRVFEVPQFGKFQTYKLIPGFICPLGLIKLTSANTGNTAEIRLRLNFIPGPYKGVLADGVRQ